MSTVKNLVASARPDSPFPLVEAVNPDDFSDFTRGWFDGPNALFAELGFQLQVVGDVEDTKTP